MPARVASTVMGVIAALIAVHLAISMIIGLIWAGILAVPVLAAIAAMTIGGRPVAGRANEKRVKIKPVRGIVDCVGESLGSGDTVRAGTGFDGPVESAFSRVSR